ncbi:MAG: D-alanyl-D-alanine carboxypeptidase/D-alanyl-D-alanine-endopeptidase [Bdellovibrio sp.]|nr:MAG: D-alanyl-D-alanine carboxypeptidase/D-alanyl-D-alanine-endopeptidase [Bdellovibrio sp.]
MRKSSFFFLIFFGIVKRSMKKICFLIFCNIIFVIRMTYGSSKAPPSSSLQIKKIVQQELQRIGLSQDSFGIVFGVPGSSPLYVLNENQLLKPASLTKLVSAAAFLHYFGPEKKFVTTIKATGFQKDSILYGDLYLVGGGDPAFVSESLWNLVNNFLRSGIKEVRGQIYVDDSRFDNQLVDGGRQFTFNDRAYSAPVSAMSFNWSSINVYVRPGNKKGTLGQVYLDPETELVKLKNKVKTVAKGPTRLMVQRQPTKQILSKNFLFKPLETISVEGQIALKEPEKVYYKNIRYPALWAGEQLYQFLKRRGIFVKKRKVSKKRVPENSWLVSQWEGQSVALLVRGMLKFSNNLIAEALTKNLAYEKNKKAGASLRAGLQWIRRYLKDRCGIKNFKMDSPSGLSKVNRFRPIDLFKLLSVIYSDFEVFPDLVSSLPLAGRDGTLKKRFSGAKGLVIRAKTGLLNGVVGVAGFGQGRNGRITQFVLLYNKRKGDRPVAVFKLQRAMDKIITRVLREWW